MKKALFCLFAVLFLCACQGPQGPQGPKGDGPNWKIYEFSVSQWYYTDFKDNNFYYFIKEVPSLTNNVFLDGNVQVYYIYRDSNGELVQRTLPYVLHMYETVDGKVNYVTRTTDFEYGVGWVQINVTDSDFMYEKDQTIVPSVMDFRVVMTW